jgi:hypothetical protein
MFSPLSQAPKVSKNPFSTCYRSLKDLASRYTMNRLDEVHEASLLQASLNTINEVFEVIGTTQKLLDFSGRASISW